MRAVPITVRRELTAELVPVAVLLAAAAAHPLPSPMVAAVPALVLVSVLWAIALAAAEVEALAIRQVAIKVPVAVVADIRKSSSIILPVLTHSLWLLGEAVGLEQAALAVPVVVVVSFSPSTRHPLRTPQATTTRKCSRSPIQASTPATSSLLMRVYQSQ